MSGSATAGKKYNEARDFQFEATGKKRKREEEEEPEIKTEG